MRPARLRGVLAAGCFPDPAPCKRKRSADGARLIGKESGRGRDITIAPHRGEFITKVEVKAGE